MNAKPERAVIWVAELLRRDGQPYRRRRFAHGVRRSEAKVAVIPDSIRAVRFVEDDGPCVWVARTPDRFMWQGGCDGQVLPTPDGPIEKNGPYCPKCGRRIEEATE